MSCRRALEIDLAEFAVEPQADRWRSFRMHYPTCPECAPEVARWSQLTSALSESIPAEQTEHPEAEALLRFVDTPAELAESERGSIELHLDGCKECQLKLRALRIFDASAPTTEPTAWLDQALAWLRALLAAPLIRPALAFAVLLLALPLGYRIWIGAGGTGIPAEAPQLAKSDPIVDPPDTSDPEPPVTPAPPQHAKVETTAPPEREPDLKPAPRDEPSPSQPEPMLVAALDPALLPPALPDYASPYPAGTAPAGRVFSFVRSTETSKVAPIVIAPAEIGWSETDGPTFYWFLNEASDTPIDVVLTDDEAVSPLIEQRVEPPVAAGIHTLSLVDLKISLREGAVYRWSVSRNALSSSALVRYEPSQAELRSRLEGSPREHAASIYARAGYWLDAFHAISNLIEANPDASAPRKHRAALLDQVELPEVAEFERRAVGLPRN